MQPEHTSLAADDRAANARSCRSAGLAFVIICVCVQNSYEQLLADRDFRIDQGEDIDNLVEYVIFMSDGDNNLPEWDLETAALCEQMTSDGLDVYSIAFAAPDKGETLLFDCASSNLGEPDDNNNKEESRASLTSMI